MYVYVPQTPSVLVAHSIDDSRARAAARLAMRDAGVYVLPVYGGQPSPATDAALMDNVLFSLGGTR